MIILITTFVNIKLLWQAKIILLQNYNYDLHKYILYANFHYLCKDNIIRLQCKSLSRCEQLTSNYSNKMPRQQAWHFSNIRYWGHSLTTCNAAPPGTPRCSPPAKSQMASRRPQKGSGKRSNPIPRLLDPAMNFH